MDVTECKICAQQAKITFSALQSIIKDK
jgi:hypothetical protein